MGRVLPLIPVLLAPMAMLLPMVLSSNAMAEKSVDIYNTSTLVINQSPEVRQKATAKGLNRVLIRLSGKKNIPQSQSIQIALQRAPDYLDRFSYQSTQQTLTIAGAARPATLLLMQFNSAAVKRLLSEANLPLWSERRPDVLVWTATDKRGKKYVDIESNMAKALNDSAADRGLPIVLPVLDLEDRRALPVARLWALDENKVRLASQRYATNAVLSGRFARRSGFWNGSFILTHKGKNRYLSAEGKSEAVVAASIVNQVSDYLANIYAVNALPNNGSAAAQLSPNGTASTIGSAVLQPSRGPRNLYLQVNNVGDFSNYIMVVKYLEALPLVSSVRVASVLTPTLLLDIELVANKDQFFSALELDNRLQRVARQGLTSSGRGDAFEFVWR